MLAAAAAAQWPQQPCNRDSFLNYMTLTSDLLTSGLMHTKQLPKSIICVPCLVLTAQAVFFLRRRVHTHTHTHTQTDATDHPVPHIGYGSVGYQHDNKNTEKIQLIQPDAGLSVLCLPPPLIDHMSNCYPVQSTSTNCVSPF